MNDLFTKRDKINRQKYRKINHANHLHPTPSKQADKHTKSETMQSLESRCTNYMQAYNITGLSQVCNTQRVKPKNI